MATVAGVSAEYGMQTDELRAYYPDGISRDMRDSDELAADVEAVLREALAVTE